MSASPRPKAAGGQPRHGVGRQLLAGLARLGRAWRALSGEQRLAAAAALGLFLSMLLPWYSLTNGRTLHTKPLSAFDDFSWVEAAVLLVAAGVLVMLFARAERKAFHLPGGDGPVILVFGGWAAALIFYRMLDKPGTQGGADVVGLRWGIFMAMAAAIALALAGYRVRAAHRPEPPLLIDQDPATPMATPGPAQRPGRPGSTHTPPLPPSGPDTAVTERLDDARRTPTDSAKRDAPRRRADVPGGSAQLSLDVPSEPAPDDQVRRGRRG